MTVLPEVSVTTTIRLRTGRIVWAGTSARRRLRVTARPPLVAERGYLGGFGELSVSISACARADNSCVGEINTQRGS